MTEDQENKTVDSSVSTDKKSVKFDGSLFDLIQGADVEWKQLGEVAEIKTGQSVSKQKIIDNPGEYPVINSGREPLGYIAEFNTENDPIGITTRGAGVGSVTYQEGKYFRGNLNYSVSIKFDEELNFKYLYHTLLFLQNEIHNLCTFSGIPALNASELKNLKIPIPSLEIQQKVVEILDKMTDYVTELTAELTLRQKQYAYYRDQLLSFGAEANPLSDSEESLGVRWTTLGEIADFSVGQAPKSNALGEFIFMNAGTSPSGYLDVWNTEGDTITTPSRGQGGMGFVDYQVEKFWCGPLCYKIRLKPEFGLTKFLFYFMSKNTDRVKSLANLTGIPALNKNSLANLKVPLPNLTEQKRIVEILDKFDKLTSNLSEGLPREIELRQKQYEYWREQLLNFN
ncbi:Type I restriction-modification system specificity subunit S [Lactococcus lactis subsp. lactis]|uniref:restriction endonuclease subunit S n=1 Tax=Lactococcus lactis TaxID=1358 RepID=UPI0007247B9E|nr:restriction endonuclease subunit S [Lactococcus lactis]KST80156.1 Type I restriction-modification system specificity subunit S [Lactococcus lactis subsp. lactis]